MYLLFLPEKINKKDMTLSLCVVLCCCCCVFLTGVFARTSFDSEVCLPYVVETYSDPDHPECSSKLNSTLLPRRKCEPIVHIEYKFYCVNHRHLISENVELDIAGLYKFYIELEESIVTTSRVIENLHETIEKSNRDMRELVSSVGKVYSLEKYTTPEKPLLYSFILTCLETINSVVIGLFEHAYYSGKLPVDYFEFRGRYYSYTTQSQHEATGFIFCMTFLVIFLLVCFTERKNNNISNVDNDDDEDEDDEDDENENENEDTEDEDTQEACNAG